MTDHQDPDQLLELQKQCRRMIHDLRTQLFCIEINRKSLQIYMPGLLNLYQEAKKADKPVPSIPDEHLEVLAEAGEDIEQQLNIINDQLDKLLHQFKTQQSEFHSQRLSELQNSAQVHSLEASHLKILLVEDEKIHQDINCKVLSAVNCSIDIAENGLQALERLNSASYDLVLMDLHMPQMNGMTTAGNIRKLDDEHRNIPIIGLSNIEPHDIEAFFSAGFNKFLLKPLKLDAFTDTIAELHAHGKS